MDGRSSKMSTSLKTESVWRSAPLAAWKWAIPDFDDKKPFTRSTLWIPFSSFPLILLQIHMLLRYNPKATWLLRASLIPFVTLVSLRSAYAYYYMVDGQGQLDGRGQTINVTLGCAAISIIIRSLEFGLARQRPRLKIHKSNPYDAVNGRKHAHRSPDPMPIFFPGTLWPLELDLLVNVRASGWEHGIKDGVPALPVPTYTRRQRRDWILKALAPIPLYFVLYDVVFCLIEDPRFNIHADSRVGGSIWDSSKGSFGKAGPYLVCVAFGSSFVCIQYMMHAILACIFVGLLDDLPSRWDPPIVSLPWLSTSVTEFWSQRWHQILRVTFMTVGFWPIRDALRPVAGRRIANMMAICGTFLVSGLLHELGRAAMTPGFGLTNVTLFFTSQPVAIFGEQLFEYCTRRRVRGFWGWLWTASWILGTAPLLLEVRTKSARYMVDTLGLGNNMLTPFFSCFAVGSATDRLSTKAVCLLQTISILASRVDQSGSCLIAGTTCSTAFRRHESVPVSMPVPTRESQQEKQWGLLLMTRIIG